MAGIQIDGVNNKIDFDDDLDTSISANTDDTLVIEAGGNTMATITATTFTINDGTTITTADNTDTLTLTSTDADANVGPVLRLTRDSSSPASDDVLGQIFFTGEDAGSNATNYASIRAIIADTTEGSEDGQLFINRIVAGTDRRMITMTGTATVFNEDSVDMDFRVESNGNANMLFVDGGNNRVGIANAPDLGVGLHIKSADSGAGANADADELVVEGSGHSGLSILSATGDSGRICFGDSGDDNIGQIIYQHGDNSLAFNTNTAERMRILNDGKVGIGTSSPIVPLSVKASQEQLTLSEGDLRGATFDYRSSTGNLNITTNGGNARSAPQLALHLNGVLSATAGVALGVGAANTASNILDDYEEGTWTIVLEDTSGNAFTLSKNTGTYIKIGGQVTVTGILEASAINSASGNSRINGLPFNILGNDRNYAAVSVGYAAGLDITAGTSISGYGNINTDNLFFTNFDASTGSTNLTCAKISGDGVLVFTTTYTVV